jgi:hypothetical protein
MACSTLGCALEGPGPSNSLGGTLSCENDFRKLSDTVAVIGILFFWVDAFWTDKYSRNLDGSPDIVGLQFFTAAKVIPAGEAMT